MAAAGGAAYTSVKTGGVMAEAAAPENGTWRKGAFVTTADVFVFVEAALVWLGLLVLVLIGVFAAAKAMHLPPDFARRFTAELRSNYALQQALTASLYLVLLFFLWRIARRVCDTALAARYRAAAFMHLLPAVLGGAVLALIVPILNFYMIKHHGLDLHATSSEQKTIPQLPGQLPFALLSLGLIVPFVEELYFRGIILGWLQRRMNVVLAVAVDAAIFGLVHLDFVSHPGLGGWYITAVLTAVGALAAVLAFKTKSLWAPFGLHAGYNATLVSLPLLAQWLR